ncbi:uncharacterized protein F5Z01DRAFT_616624 [Emericellopsis atlantica]|uniref:Zn(2)-C6 fungal-type domain-containing protein n=1 Tax=Emericellopsis atlantica TaxID=2614577 RepID=A0A9P7ZSL9_9HYPO|nr:uncharacterized protein F5Z01DRAFT_616624 [Emericellopsis atlantica]KAG9257573.1 hypothetical protein F5Z01DRAFT_616624 [Emericellopsis atlantica]
MGLVPAPSHPPPYEATSTVAATTSSSSSSSAAAVPFAQQQQTPPSQGHTPQGHQLLAPTTYQHPSLQPAAAQQTPHGTQAQPRSVKRPRPVKSCTECRKRKLKCDRLCPCSQCQKSNRGCRYAADNDSNHNLSDASDEEGTDAGSTARPTKRLATDMRNGGSMGTPGQQQVTAAQTLPILEQLVTRMERIEKHLLGSNSPETTSNHTGGSARGPPEIAPATARGLSIKQGGYRTRIYGPSSPRVMLNLFQEAQDFMRHHNKDPEMREVFASFKKLHKLMRTEFTKSMMPISVFVDSMMPVRKRMVDILPPKPVCDRLVRGYLDNHETLYRIIHAPSFMAQYNAYWDGTLQLEAFLPKLLAILALASRYETKSRGLGRERSEGAHLPTACALVRLWLNNLQGKILAEIDTLQVEVLWFAIVRSSREHPRDGWAQLGTIVRMALGMGLHRDPSEFGSRITPFNGEIRRRLWATIINLDIYVSNDCDMPSTLHEECMTTKPPRNLDDAEIYPEMAELPPSRPFDQVTDNHAQAYAATTLSLRRRAVSLIARLDSVRDWSEILDVAGQLEKHLEHVDYILPRYRPTPDSRKARRWRCRGLLDAHIRTILMNLYRPFVLGSPSAPPQAVRAYLRHSLQMVLGIEELDPSMPEYEEVADLCHSGNKSAAMQAALSLCYYIRAQMRDAQSDPAAMAVQQALSAAPDPSDLDPTAPQLIQSVERVIGFLVQNIKCGDTKDIICLSLVLESVRTPEPRPDEMAHGLRVVLDQCLRAANCSLERLATAQPASSSSQQQAYPAANAYPASGNLMGSLADEDGWMFWDGWGD